MCLRTFIVLIFIPFLFYSQGKNQNDNQIINLLKEIDPIPISIDFQNSLNTNNKGGHLQGIQYLKFNQNSYYVLTGSSDTYSYFSILKSEDKNRVISTNKILERPFKHAGGFQIYNKLMAIGVEDNSAKTRSKVFIYSIVNPEKSVIKTLATIVRDGVAKRATAGCVGIIEIDDFILVLVGDWDTKNLDFYRIKKEKLGIAGEEFELVYSIEANKMDRSEWIDKSWYAYQNINFINDSSGNIYLAGMTSNSDRNILDLYKVETNHFTSFNLNKIYTKKLLIKKYADFRWSAGINLSEENELRIFSTGSHIQQEFEINIYK